MNLDRLITETLRRQLIVENARNNSWRAARTMVIAKFGYTKEEAEKVLDEICTLVGISYEMIKFIKGCTRMTLNGELNDPQVLNDFKDALNKIKTDGHIGEFDTDLRRLDQPEGTLNSAKDIIKIFKPEIDRERAEQREKLSGRTFEANKNYKIVKINSFDEARKYSQYTSWCVTSNEGTYNGYTGNGINQFYFCLQNGFEDIENNGNFNNTKDEYALSMLAILVNPEGELIHCTNRKNNDQSTLNPEGISELLGCNFYETFKPNTTWLDALEDAKSKLASGVPIKKVFNDARRDGDLVLVSLLGRWNILGEGNTFLCDNWYDDVWDFKEGFAKVQDVNNGFNFINRDGKELCDRWYGYVREFSEGFAAVKDETKGWSFINREGKEAFGRWYNFVWDFSEGFAIVRDKTKCCNFINREGKEICDHWYNYVGDFHEDFAQVENKNKGWNFINREGKEVCERWYDGVLGFEYGFARVRDENNRWNFINREGEEIGDRWYDYVNTFYDDFAVVIYKGKFYWLRKDGVLCDSETKKPIEDSPIQMAESLIDRLVRGVLIENRKQYYL